MTYRGVSWDLGVFWCFFWVGVRGVGVRLGDEAGDLSV